MLRSSSGRAVGVFDGFDEMLRNLIHALPLGTRVSLQDLEGHLSAQPQALHQKTYGHTDRATLLQCSSPGQAPDY